MFARLPACVRQCLLAYACECVSAYMCLAHRHTDTYMHIRDTHRDTQTHTDTYVLCVCVCVCAHTHTFTLSHTHTHTEPNYNTEGDDTGRARECPKMPTPPLPGQRLPPIAVFTFVCKLYMLYSCILYSCICVACVSSCMCRVRVMSIEFVNDLCLYTHIHEYTHTVCTLYVYTHIESVS